MKDILGYEGLYAITSCGRVWSYRYKKFLSPFLRTDGYLAVGLYKDGQQKSIAIHRLVAEAYIPNPLGLPVVNHKDEEKTHNWINNLEWCDMKYNSNYGTGKERAAKARKKQIYCVELDRVFDGAVDACKELGINAGNLSSCCRGRKQTCGGYHWRYVE